MSGFVGRSVLVAGLVLVLAASVAATVPVIQEGECVYLLGAPPGGTLAGSEERESAAFVRERCDTNNFDVEAATNRDGENMVQLYLHSEGTSTSRCQATGWVGHAFEIDARGPRDVFITMEGIYRGFLLGSGTQGQAPLFTLAVELLKADPSTATKAVAVSSPIHESLPVAAARYDEAWGKALSARLEPDSTYWVRMRMEAGTDERNEWVDFGSQGSGNFARYDRIKVCVEEPPGQEEILERLNDLEAAVLANGSSLDDLAGVVASNSAKLDGLKDQVGANSDKLDGLQAEVGDLADSIDRLSALLEREAGERIEWELLNKDCRAGLWLPVAQGGRLEEARDLVGGLVAQAVGTGAPGVNGKVATARLDEADHLMAAGDFQKACQRLSDALRALTTP